MEAITLGSRSIVQDKFFHKEQDEKYKKHQMTVSSINKEKLQSLKTYQKQIETLASSLRKSKSAAKLFREKEEKTHLKQQNMNLLKKIWNLQPSVKTYNPDKYQYVSGSNWNLHKKKLEQIKEENKWIGKKVISQHVDSADYKKKLKEQIKEYIERRQSIRKCKFVSKGKHSKSEKKIVAGVKLQKIGQPKKDAELIKKEGEKQRENPETKE